MGWVRKVFLNKKEGASLWGFLIRKYFFNYKYFINIYNVIALYNV